MFRSPELTSVLTSVLRVDAGSELGMGHLIRMHALSQALSRRSIRCHFLTVSRDATAWMRARKMSCRLLDVDAGSPGDTAAVLEYADRVHARWVVTDGRHFGETYLNSLTAGGIPVISIDDIGENFFPSALVVNGGMNAESMEYRVLPTTSLLLGPKYLLLRPEFGHRRAKPRSKVRRILVCFGGADPEDYTGRVLDILEGWTEFPEDIEVNAVVGPAYSRLNELGVRASHRIRVLADIDAATLVELMVQSDLAITSAGMVACEVAAVGIVSLLVAISDDQVSNATALVASGAARVIEPFDAKHLVCVLRDVLSDTQLRQSMVDASRNLVDGQGGDRVANAILALDQSSVGQE